MFNWKPIETAPRDGTDIVLLCPVRGWPDQFRAYVGSSYKKQCWSPSHFHGIEDSEIEYVEPIGWLPLPATDKIVP
jgi:hypothetical protein